MPWDWYAEAVPLFFQITLPLVTTFIAAIWLASWLLNKWLDDVAAQLTRVEKLLAGRGERLPRCWWRPEPGSPETIEQLIAEQQVPPIADIANLSGAIPDEDVDEFVAEIYRDRKP